MATALARRFRYMIDQLCQGNKKAFAEMTGKSASHIYKICRGASRPSLAYLQQLNDQWQIDLNWLLTGDSADQHSQTNPLRNEDVVLAPIFDVSASAGIGETVNTEEVDGYFTFNKSWLSQTLGISSEKLVFVSIKGDSMKPTLLDGDQVLVDLSKNHINNRNVYLMHCDQGLLVKRLAMNSDTKISVISDNPEYDEWTLCPEQDDEIRVLGQVVWCSRAIGKL